MAGLNTKIVPGHGGVATRADVVANVAVIFSGLAVMLTGLRYFDLFVGAAIGVYVIREALEIPHPRMTFRRFVLHRLNDANVYLKPFTARYGHFRPATPRPRSETARLG